jgi:hypothetical protein
MLTFDLITQKRPGVTPALVDLGGIESLDPCYIATIVPEAEPHDRDAMSDHVVIGKRTHRRVDPIAVIAHQGGIGKRAGREVERDAATIASTLPAATRSSVIHEELAHHTPDCSKEHSTVRKVTDCTFAMHANPCLVDDLGRLNVAGIQLTTRPTFREFAEFTKDHAPDSIERLLVTCLSFAKPHGDRGIFVFSFFASHLQLPRKTTLTAWPLRL